MAGGSLAWLWKESNSMKLSDLAQKAKAPNFGEYSFLQKIFYYFSRQNEFINPVKEVAIPTGMLVTFGSTPGRPNEYRTYIPVENKDRYLEEASRGAKLIGLKITSVKDNSWNISYEVDLDISKEDLIKMIGLLHWNKLKETYSL